MNRIQILVVCLIVSGIYTGASLAGTEDRFNQLIKKYSDQEIVCLDIGEQYRFKMKDGSKKLIRLVSVEEHRDSVVKLVRWADVVIEVEGKNLHLACAPYTMPTEFNGIRIQADTTSAWHPLPKRVQFSIWDSSDPIVNTEQFGFPLSNYALFSHGMQAYNEVVHLGWMDGCPKGVAFYHDYGIDFGGYEGRQSIVSCTDGTVLQLSTERKHIFVVIQDDDGFIWDYGHFDSIALSVKKGTRIKRGQKIGVLGKTGPSGNFSHLHLGTYVSRSDFEADKSNRRLNLYPWIVTTYARQCHESLYAVARPHQTASTGEKVVFDASRCLSFGPKIVSYQWVLPDRQTDRSMKAETIFDKPGIYIATLWIKDEQGNQDVDFGKVKVFTASSPEGSIPTIYMTHVPAYDIVVDQPVFFQLWLQGVDKGLIEIDFGDGTIIRDYVSYSEIQHSFKSPGIHIITARSTIDGKPIIQKQKVVVSRKER
jgi:murein DD-endopeptidase MepM/ murein hydrolase activator NlpD